MIQEGLEVALRVEVARSTAIIKVNAFCLLRHGKQNGMIIVARELGLGGLDVVPMCFHGLELVLGENSVAAVCGTYELVVCIVPICGPAVGLRYRQHSEFSLSEKLSLT